MEKINYQANVVKAKSEKYLCFQCCIWPTVFQCSSYSAFCSILCQRPRGSFLSSSPCRFYCLAWPSCYPSSRGSSPPPCPSGVDACQVSSSISFAFLSGKFPQHPHLGPPPPMDPISIVSFYFCIYFMCTYIFLSYPTPDMSFKTPITVDCLLAFNTCMSYSVSAWHMQTKLIAVFL